MPAPGGCYALLADEPDLGGTSDYVNGPATHARLTDLPLGTNWRRRIRAVVAGPGAAVTLWTDEGFRGAQLRVEANVRHERLPPTFDRAVESLEVACLPSK